MTRILLLACALALTSTAASAQARRLQPPPTAEVDPFRSTTESPARRPNTGVSGSIDGTISGKARNSINGSARGPVDAFRPEPGFKIR